MAGSTDGGRNVTTNSNSGDDHFHRRFSLEILAVTFLVAGGLCFLSVPYDGSFSDPVLRRYFPPTQREDTRHESTNVDDPELITILRRATTTTPPSSIPSRTVILVTITEALAKPDSMLDLFLESFWVGNNTHQLLRHLVIVSLDHKAHQRCQDVHPHCYKMSSTSANNLTRDALFMTQEYLVVVWRKIELVASVLRLGYDLILTDVDIVWFRNPFPHLATEPVGSVADIQVACDHFRGNSSDPNTGFFFMRSNNRTILFVNHWYESKDKYHGKHDQDVFSQIIRYDPLVNQIGLHIRFLDTVYFGGFCELVKDLDLATTMHANCCVGMGTKLHDLRIVLQDWKHFSSTPNIESRNSTRFEWEPPRVECRPW